jgi:amino acid transporter
MLERFGRCDPFQETIMATEQEPRHLRRALTLPWLVFYGLGVTVGAGIFALIGEILALAGDAAPMSFLLAAAIAGATGLSYALLVRVFPKAGGEAVFVNRGLGEICGRLAGIGVVATGIISSAVIALAFTGYAGSLVAVPAPVLLLAVVGGLTGIAAWGVRESVAFAAMITVLEVGTLVVVIGIGAPLLANLPPVENLLGIGSGWHGFAPVAAGSILAFFAFIGFEDIENMAEETVDPARTSPRAILWTLVITLVIYVTLALVAVSLPDRASVAGSPAPLAVMFENVTGFSGKPVAALAAIAMVNGILIQIVMAARVLYGMANEGLIPVWFGAVHPGRRTPMRATLSVSAVILVLALTFPLVALAEATSYVILGIFAMVNLALFALGARAEHPTLRRWRWWGILGAALCIAVPVIQFSSGLVAGH